jgi:flagellar biosynthesis/type III secretory pathway M-ring protein FliF/YscJ
MNSVGIPDIIAVYGSAFIILLLLIAVFIFRIIRNNKKKMEKQSTVSITPAEETTKHKTYPLIRSGVQDRILPSSDTSTNNSKQNSVIKNIELLSQLKQGILWAEILGRPGGRHRRNT